MKKNLLPLLLLSAAGLCNACMQDKDGMPVERTAAKPQLTVEEAYAFFEKSTVTTRSESADEVLLPFVMGDAVLNWEKAAVSASDRLSSVDIPADGEYTYRVIREHSDGTPYEVTASSKIIVVKSHRTDLTATYIRVCIPDEEYAAFCDGNISDMTLNCEDRVDYSGLEYYATLDGYPIGVARYAGGKCLGNVYLFDETLTSEEIGRRYAALLDNMWIIREPKNGNTRTIKDEWHYGAPNTIFMASDGEIYIYVDTDGNGKSDAITQFFPITPGGGGSPSSGGGNGGGSSGGSGNNGETGPGNTGGSGGPGNYSGNTGDNKPGETPVDIDGNTEEPESPKPPKKDLPRNPNIDLVNPHPWQPDTPGAWPPEEDDPTEEKPCFDAATNEANPLMEMKISTDNGSWRKNIWGKVRSEGTKLHDGLDLAGESGVTPVYAMYGGKVIRVVSNQPNRITNEDYPTGYKGDKNNAGNRITIETKLANGKTIHVSYWHLDIAANNPYTQTFKIGSTVEQGQIIGIVGTTGNAIGGLPHLHVKTYIVGTDKANDPVNDPFNYLYTKFDPQTGNSIRDCK